MSVVLSGRAGPDAKEQMTLPLKSRSPQPATLAQFARALRKGGAVTWRDLDPYLDGGPEAFPRDCKRLGRVLDRLATRVVAVVPGAPEYDDPFHFHVSLKSDGVLPYEKELARQPRLSRAGEFRMARRYEFLRMRASDSLKAAGFAGDEIEQLLVQGDLENVTWPVAAKRNITLRRRAIRRVAEFETLRNAFLEGSLYLVLKGVHKYRKLGIDTLDLIQEGNISLFQAAEGFDWRRDVRFKTYAEYWINQAFLKMLYNNVRTVRVPVWVQKLLKKIKDLQTEAVNKTGRELTHSEVGRKLNIPAEKVNELLKTQRYAISLDAEVGDEDGSRMSDLLEDQRSVPVPEQVVDVRLKDRIEEVLQDLPERERLILTLRFGLDGKPARTLFEVGQILKVSAERVRQLQESALKRLKLPKSRKRLAGFRA